MASTVLLSLQAAEHYFSFAENRQHGSAMKLPV